MDRRIGFSAVGKYHEHFTVSGARSSLLLPHCRLSTLATLQGYCRGTVATIGAPPKPEALLLWGSNSRDEEEGLLDIVHD